jgi:signal peptidase I
MEENEKPNKRKEFFSLIKMIIIAFILALCINNFIIINASVPTGSMEDTIMAKTRMMGFRLSYLFDDPQRGDIVIFKFPDNEKETYVKRVIGLPGDTVQIVDGLVYINGSSEPLEEDYLKETPLGSYGPFTVPEGHYFVMGDNRNDSNDSRYWIDKYVSENKILGKAILTYWPKVHILN